MFRERDLIADFAELHRDIPVIGRRRFLISRTSDHDVAGPVLDFEKSVTGGETSFPHRLYLRFSADGGQKQGVIG